ncbi:MAG: iron ABC transporter permease [Chloroflexota bacterium]
MAQTTFSRMKFPVPGAAVLRLAGPLVTFGAAFLLATLYGSVAIPKTEVVQILLHRIGLYGTSASWSPGDESIVWDIRLPEVLAAALVGGALSVAGALFQAVLRNPLADPYVVGTAAGAQLGVTLGLILPITLDVAGFGPIQILAFGGALGTVFFVYGLARSGGRTPVVTLLLAGFVTSSFLISATSLLMDLGGRVNQVTRWTLGGIELTSLGQLAVVTPVIIVSFAVAMVLGPRLNLLLLGEEQAAHLGVRVEALKMTAITVAALLTAMAVTLGGIIAFVGLIVPHAVRLVYGPGHRVLIPVSAIGGATFLMLADLIARVAIAPTALPLGVVTAVIGAPFFLHLLRRSKRDYAL